MINRCLTKCVSREKNTCYSFCADSYSDRISYHPKVNSQETMLKAGIARTEITPTENLTMGGYDMTFRPGRSDGVYGSIYTRALVFDDGSKQVVIIETDIVSIPDNEYLSISKPISEKTGIPVENIHAGLCP